MKPLKLILVIIIALGWNIVAQAQDDLKVIDVTKGVDADAVPELDKFVLQEDRTPVYLNKEFYTASITLNDVQLTNCPTQYNVRNQELVVRIAGQLWTLEDKSVDKFTWNSPKAGEETFENANNFNLDASHMPGFMQVCNTGSTKLLVHFKAEVQENYNPTEMYATTLPDYIVITNYYVDNGEKTLYVEKNKKEIIGLFGDQSAQVATFMKKNKVKVGKPVDLGRAFQHYNSLNASLASDGE